MFKVPREIRFKPVVYAWFRDSVCLYVGKTKHLPERLTGHQHIKHNRIHDDDKLCVYVTDKENNRFMEHVLIYHFKPVLNIDRNLYCTRNRVIPNAPVPDYVLRITVPE
jgi:excinuclease UvrABC nuclease subunit